MARRGQSKDFKVGYSRAELDVRYMLPGWVVSIAFHRWEVCSFINVTVGLLWKEAGFSGMAQSVQELCLHQTTSRFMHSCTQYALSTCHASVAILSSYIFIVLHHYSLSHTLSFQWNNSSLIDIGFRELKITQVRVRFRRGDGIWAGTWTCWNLSTDHQTYYIRWEVWPILSDLHCL